MSSQSVTRRTEHNSLQVGLKGGGLFSLLMLLEGAWPGKVIAASVCVEYVQLLAFVVNPYFEWGPLAGIFPDMVYMAHIPVFEPRYSSLSYLEYSAFLWLFVCLMMVLCGCAVVFAGHEKRTFRVLRPVFACLTSWMYIPLMHCVFAMIVCNDGHLWLFPETTCWSSSHALHLVVSTLALLVYLPSVYIIRRSVFEASPTCRYYYAKAHSKLDGFDFCFKTSLIILFHFMVSRGHTVAFAIVIGCASLVMSCLYAYTLPYFDKSCNCIKVSQMVTLLAVCFVYLVTEIGDFSEPDCRGILLLSIVPCVGICGYVFGTVRVNPVFLYYSLVGETHKAVWPLGLAMCDIALPGSADYVGSKSEQGSVITHSVMQSWDDRIHDGSPTVPYVARVNTETDVELCTRCIDTTKRHTSFVEVTYACHIFAKGLLKFRDGALVKLHYVWFLLCIADRPQQAYAYFERNEDLLRVFSFDVSFFLKYNSRKVVEKLRRKLNIRERHHEAYGRKAVALHQEVLKQMHQFWQKLMELSADMHEVGHLASSIAENRETCMTLFKRALTGDVKMLNNFADFLEGVMLNKEAANLCMEEIAELEMEKKARQMGAAKKAAQSADGNIVQRLLDNVSSQKDTFGTAASSTVRRLSINMNLVFALLTLLIVRNFVSDVDHFDMQMDAVRKMDAAGKARMLAQKAAYEIYDLFSIIETEIISQASGNAAQLDQIEQQRLKLASTAARFTDAHGSLTHGAYATSYSPHVRYYEEPINEIVLNDNTTVLMSLWEIGNKITNALHTIDLNLTYDLLNPPAASNQLEQLTTPLSQAMSSLLKDDSVYFMLTNTPFRVAVAFNRSMVFYEDESTYRLNYEIYNLLALFIISILIICAIYLLFLWNFKKITVSKLVILQLFTLIPYDTLARLSADAKERLVLKGSGQHKRVKKGFAVLPKNILEEMHLALQGANIENATPLQVLEEYLNESLDPNVMSKLKKYIKMLKNKTKYDALDPEMLAFVRLNIFNVSLPPSILKTDGGKKAPNTHKVGFKGKTILGGEEDDQAKGETSENEDREGTKLDREEGIIATTEGSERAAEKTQTQSVPPCFWLLNLLLVVLAATSLSLTMVSYVDIVELYDPFEQETERILKTQELQMQHIQAVELARYYAHLGDIRYYLRLVDTLNNERTLVLEQELITSGLTSKEMAMLQEGKPIEAQIYKTLRVSMALTTLAFAKDAEMTKESADTSWDTPDERLLQRGTHFETIQKYGQYIRDPTTLLFNKEKSVVLDAEEQQKAAKALLFSDVFQHNYEKLNKVVSNLADTVSKQRDEGFGNKVRVMLYIIVSMMYTGAVVAILIIYVLQVSPSLEQYRKLWVWYLIASLCLLVVPVLLLVETAMITEAEDAMLVSHALLRDFHEMQLTLQKGNQLMQSFVEFQTESHAVAYIEEAAVLRFVGYKALISRHTDDVVLMRTLEEWWAYLEKLQLISASLVISSMHTIHLLEDFVANVTWNASAEAQYHEQLYTYPVCEDRDVGCRSLKYTDSVHDLRLESEEKKELAQEILFTNPYTERLNSFNNKVSDAKALSHEKLVDDVVDKTDRLKSLSLVFFAIISATTVYVLLAAGYLVGHILIELAGKQQKQKTNQLDSPLLRVMLVRCRLSLCLVACLIAIIFAVGVWSVEATRDQAKDLNLVSAREWLVARSMVYADQFDSGNSEVQGIAQAMLGSIVVELVRIRDKLYFGDPGSSSYNEVQNTDEQNQLTFGWDDTEGTDKILSSYYSDACDNPMAVVAEVPEYSNSLSSLPTPLELALHTWQGDVRYLMRAACTDTACTERTAALSSLRSQVDPLIDALEQSSTVYEDNAILATKNFSTISKVLFGMTLFIILLLYILVFRKMVGKLTHEENGTKGVLKMIPQAVVESVPAISEYLETGRVDNTEQLAKNFEQSEKLLANILPENISRRLKSGESPIADTHASITILFTDFVGFTSISSSLSAVEIISFLNEVFLEFDTIAELLELEKIKTIGDAYFMAGGLKPSITDHAVRVVEAGLLMFEALDEHNQRHTDRKELRMRLGCHTGPCVAGCIGVKKVAYDLWGESVAMAEKMESGGVPGRVHMSTTTTAEVESLYITEPRDHPKFTSFLVVDRKQPSPYMHLVRSSSRVPVISPSV